MVLLSSGSSFAASYTSVVSGNFNNPATWGTTSAPHANDTATIQAGYTVTLSIADTVNVINIYGTLQWGGGFNLIINSGGINVYGGGNLNGDVVNAFIIFNQNNKNNYIQNAGNFEIYNILVGGSSSKINITGNSPINITNYLLISSSSLKDTVICENTGSISINSRVTFDNDSCQVILRNGCNMLIGNDLRINNSSDINNSFKVESGGSLTINGNINFNGSYFNIYNYGTLSQIGNFQSVSSNRVLCYNYANAIWNYSGSAYDSDLRLYCNNTNSTFNYNNNGDQNVYTPQDAYWNLILSNSGDKYLNGNIIVNNDLTISGSVNLDVDNTNNYQITLSGNWNNSANFKEQQGTVVLNGNGDQTITKTTGEGFWNLSVNKLSGSVIFTSIDTVKNNLNLYNGNINTGTFQLVLSNSNPSNLNYYSGHIIGKLERYINSTYLNTDYLFPIGNATTYNPVILNFSDISNGYVSAEFFSTDPGSTGLPIIEGSTTIVNQFNNGYWKLKSDGIFASTDYDISLTANSFDNYEINSSTHVLVRPSTTGVWDDPISGTHADATSNVVFRNNILTGISSTGTEYGLGHTDCDISFNAHPSDFSTCAGSTASFSVDVTGAVSWQWQKNGTNLSNGADISGATLATLNISNVAASDEGNYACLVTTCASALSNSASLNISQPFISLGFSYERTITIYDSYVSGVEDLLNFPVLISLNDGDFADTTNGGKVFSANGYDIAFTDASGYKLDHQIEYYNPATGKYIAWVRVPLLFANQNTYIKMLYGNPQVTINPSAETVWNGNYMAVWHFNNSISDATSNGRNLTDPNSNTANLTSSIIGDGRDLNNNPDRLSSSGLGRYLRMPNGFLSGVTNFSFEGWVYLDRDDTQWERIFDFGQGNTTDYFFLCPSTAGGSPSSTAAKILVSPSVVEQGPTIVNPTANTGSWIHWSVVLDAVANTMTVYRNGVFYGSSGGVTFDPQDIEATNTNYLGRSQWAPDHYIDAKFDEFRMSTTARTAGWIATSYNNQNSPSTFCFVSSASPHSEYNGFEACQYNNTTYSIPDLFDSYEWVIEGDGDIIGVSDSNSVTVRWNSDANDSIKLKVTDNSSCTDSSLNYGVTVLDAPNPDIQGDTLICPGEGTNKIYKVTPVADNSYVWSVKGGNIPGDVDLDSVIVNLINENDTIIIAQTNATGCTWYDSLAVWVGDTTKPEITCKDTTIYLNSSGQFTIDSNFVYSNITEACGIDSVVPSRYLFDCADVGTPSSINVTAYDLSGNTRTCPAVVTAMDTITPVITCKDTTIYLNSSGQFTIDSSFVYSNITEACGIDSVVPERYFFDCADVGTPASINVTAYDLSGNTRTCPAMVTAMDTITPVITCKDTTIYLNSSGQFTIDSSFVYSNITEACSIDSVVTERYFFDCADVGTPASINVTAYDLSGNTRTCTAVVSVLDTITPVITCKDTTIYLNSSGQFTIDSSFFYSNITEACSIDSVVTERYFFDCADVGTPASINVTAYDLSGNTRTCTAVVSVLDTITPVITCKDTTIYLNSSGQFTIDSSFVYSNVVEACGIDSIVPTRTLFDCADVGSPVNINITAYDIWNNSYACSAAVTVIDTITPVLTCKDTTIYLNSSGQFTIDSSFVYNNVIEACGIDSIVPARTLFDCADVGSPVNINITAYDLSGNTYVCSADVTVLDTIRPVLTCKDTTIYLNSSGQFTIDSSFVYSNVVEACGIDSIVPARTLFDCADVGSLVNINVTAYDLSGNTYVCSADVTVLDTISPVLTCKDTTIYLNSSGQFTIDSSFVYNNVIEACGIDSIVPARTLFDCADVGSPVNINITAYDIWNNSYACSAAVTVIDTITPVLTCKDTTIYLNSSGQFTIDSSFVYSNITEACGIDSVVPERYFFDCTDVGTPASIIVTAYDLSGNTRTCPAVVSVLDTITPVITCKDTTIYLNSSGQFTIDSSFVYSNITEACGIDSVVPERYFFDCADVGTPASINVTAYDLSGNTRTCPAVVSVLDTIAPVITCKDTTIYLNSSGQFTIDSSFVYSNITEACGIDSVVPERYFFDCADVGTPASINVTAYDLSGNTRTCPTVVSVLDTIAPVITCKDTTIYLNSSGQFTIDSSFVYNNVIEACGIDSIVPARTLFDCADVGSPVNINITAYDLSGNTYVCSADVTVLDTISPVLTCKDTTIYLNSSGQFTIDSSFVYNNVIEACGIDSIVPARTLFDCADVGSPVNINITAYDIWNNSYACSAAVTVIDTITPVLTCKDTTIYLNSSGQFTIDSSFVYSNITEACGIDSVVPERYFFDCTDVGTPASINVTAYDLSGNTRTCPAVVSVLDTIAPVITCKDTTIYLNSSGQFTIDSSFVYNNVIEACGIDSIVPARTLFDCADVGSHVNINITAYDLSGNTYVCSADVTVLDTISPVLTCKDTTIYLNSSGQFTIDSSFVYNNVIEACGIDSIVPARTLFDCADVGSPVNINITAYDIWNNSYACSAAVTVIDTITPVLTCKDTTIYLNSSGQFTIDSSFVYSNITEACGIDSVVPERYFFDCTDVGTPASINVTAYDLSGNTRTCPAVVSVLDTITPLITCKDTTIYLNSSGQFTIDSSFVYNNVIEACGIDSIVPARTLFDCADVGSPVNINITAYDLSGNTYVCSADVTVLDTISPVLTCKDTTIYLNSSGQFTIDSSFVYNNVIEACGIDSIVPARTLFDCADVGSPVNINITAYDIWNNSYACSAAVTVIDTITPVLTCKDTTIYLNSSGQFTIDSSFVYSNITEACGIDSVVPERYFFDCADVGTPASINVTAYDLSGNTRTCPAVVSVLDTITPVITCKDTTIYLNSSGQFTIDSSFVYSNITEACGIDSVVPERYFFDCTDVGTPASINVTAYDLSGNTRTCPAVVSVLDTITPLITCKDTTIYLNSSGQFTIDSSFVYNNVIEACGIDSIVPARTLFDCADVGSPVNINITAYDLSGNTYVCSADVTVLDTIRPVLTCKDTTIYLNSSGQFTIDSSFVYSNVVEACGIDSIVPARTLFDCADVGSPVNINVSAYDIWNNSFTCSAAINVIDTISPVLTCKDTTIYLNSSGKFTIDSSFVYSGLSEACGTDSIVAGRYIFDCADMVSPVNITVTAYDIWGNSSSCIASVTVIDTLNPTVICKNINVFLDDTTGLVSITPADIDNGTFDNCSIATLTISKSVFNSTNLGDNNVTLIAKDIAGNIDSCIAVVTVYYETTPVVTIDPVSDTICNGDAFSINISCNIDSTSYSWTVSAFDDIIGESSSTSVVNDFTLSQNLTNLSDSVLKVIYTLSPVLYDLTSLPDTSIEIWVEPFPQLEAYIDDTVFCDSSEISISVDDLNGTVFGDKVYSLITNDANGFISGYQTPGEYPAGTSITDTLINHSSTVQSLTYQLKPRIKNPFTGTFYCDKNNDTIITLYINPTPRLSVSVPDTIFCDSSEVTITVNDLLLGVQGTKVYQLTTSNAGGNVLGVQTSGEYAAGLDITDTLVNLTNQFQVVTYNFKAKIRDDRNGTVYCDQGGDTTITLYINPTPRLNVSVPDTIFCDSSEVNITVNDGLLGVQGNKVYQLTTTNAGGNVLGVQSSGEYASGTDITDTLVNLTNQVQAITYNYKARIKDPRGDDPFEFCSQGGDTTITIYVNPTPMLSVSVPDTIFCDSSEVIITVNDGLLGVQGNKVYQLTTTNAGGNVIGVQASGEYAAGTDITDTLVNLTNQVQVVSYNFKARIRDDRNGTVYCNQGEDTTIIIYINPTPRLSVSVPDTIFCDSSEVTITVNDELLGVQGTKVYELSTTDAGGNVLGVQASGEYASGTDITDTLVNLTNQVQVVTYNFKAKIRDDRNGTVYCDQGGDTTITLYINPTPRLNVSVPDTIFCDSSEVNITVNDGLLGVQGNKVYQLTTTNAGGNVLGVQASGEYAAGTDITDTLVNLTNQVQVVTYNFKAKIRDDRNGTVYCDQGGDTTITLYINPTPRLNVSVPDTIFCDSSEVNITVNDGLLGVQGNKVYQLTTTNAGGNVLGVQASGEYAAGTDITDTLVNLTNQVQVVTYNFKARIRDDRNGTVYCDQGGDTTITLYINPTPRLTVSVPDTIFCDSSEVIITVNDGLLGVQGTKVYELSTTDAGGNVLGVQASGEYASGTDITDTLVNLTNQFQVVTYNFKAKIRDDRNGTVYCDQGGDTTIIIYINPTPRLSVSVPDTIFCDSSEVTITVNDELLGVQGTKVYELSTTDAGGNVLGVQASGEYASGTDITDTLVNLTNQVQVVTYNFKAKIRDDRNGTVYCDQGGDTTITLYINPTPRLNVSVPDTIFCDSSEVNITVNDGLLGVQGNKVYQLTTTNAGGNVLGVQSSGEYAAGTDITDTLVNLTNQVQTVTYNFKARIKDPRGDNPFEFCSQGGDTTITIYVNPTPRLSVSVPDTIFCDSSEVIITVNDGLLGVQGNKVYQLTTTNAGGNVLGVQASGEYAAGTDITDTLVNLTNQVQVVTYNFKARIRDDRNGTVYCDQGGDTTITLYINPTPRLTVSVPDTIFCDSSEVNITVNDGLLGVQGNKVYQLTTTNAGGNVLGVQASGEYAAGADITDTLVNLTNQVQTVTYNFKARIKDPRGDNPFEFCSQGGDTTITIYVNPTPRLSVSVPDTIFCDSSEVTITVNDNLLSVQGAKVYELTTTDAGGNVLGIQASGEYASGTDITDTLVNLTNQVQVVTYNFKARIRDDRNGTVYCDQGGDTTITLYINPTPRLTVSVPDTIFCDSSEVNITVNDGLLGVQGNKVYQLTTTNAGGNVLGVQASGEYAAGTDITDTFVNLTNQVQTVTYNFKARIKDPRGDNPFEFCSQGGDTTITIYVNPTPRLSVSVPDTIFCDSSEVTITVNDELLGVQGTKVYELTTTDAGGNVLGVQSSGEYAAGTDITDTLVNLTNQFQVVTYNFKAKIRDDRNGTVYCDQGGDTTITLYINPTPRLNVSVPDTIFCDSSEVNITVNDGLLGVQGNKVYQLTTTNAGGKVLGVQSSGEYAAGTDITDTLVNLTNQVQTVTYNFKARIKDPRGDNPFEFCSQGGDTTISIYVNPTPRLSVSVPDTIFCDSSEVTITVNDNLLGVQGTKVYQLTTDNAGGTVLGMQTSGEYLAGTDITDTLVNLTNQVQVVTYNFKARIRDDRNGTVYCDQGGDTTITLYINPTPRLTVSVPDTIFCDSSEVNITVNDGLLGVQGNKVYQLTTTNAGGNILGVQASGEYAAGTDITDTLVNLTNQVQAITYNFKARIKDPRGDDPFEFCSQGGDTTITIYVNPTPRLSVSVPDTIFCDSSEVTIAVNDELLGVQGTKVYQLTTDNAGGTVLGMQTSGEYLAGTDITDTLVNLTNQVQVVIYNFKARIRDDRNGTVYCDQGGDTTIRLYINPTPRLTVSVSDTIFCDSSEVNITVNDGLLGVQGNKVYQLTTTNAGGNILGVQASGEYAAGTDITDTLVNLTNQVQAITYNFKARIKDPRGDDPFEFCSQGGDTTITIYINPTPRLSVSVPDTIFCDSSEVPITVNDELLGVQGTKVYELTTTDAGGTVLGVQASGEYAAGLDIVDTLVNLTDTFQVVSYRFKARIKDPRGINPGYYCDQGHDTIIFIYVEPTSKLSAEPQFDTLCNNDSTYITFTSPTHSVNGIQFNYIALPDNPGSLFIKSGNTNTNNLTTDSIVSHQLINISDTFQRIVYIFTPVTLDVNHNQKCPGIPDTVIIWVEPSAKIIPIPQQDTICNYDFTNIHFTSPTIATIGVNFNILAVPDHPTRLSGYSNVTYYTEDSILSQQLTNISDSAQRIRYIVTPYTLNDKGDQKCEGIPVTITIFVEPTAKLDAAPSSDTLCNLTSTSIRLIPKSYPTRLMEFNFVVVPDNPLSVKTDRYAGNRLTKDSTIVQVLENLGDTAQRILYIITPYLVDAANNQKCEGINDTVIIWLEPTLRFTLTPTLDTICDGSSSNIVITSPVQPTHPVRFRYFIQADHIGSLGPFTVALQEGLFKNDTIIEPFINLTDTAQRVIFTFTSYSTDDLGNTRCEGLEHTAVVWVEPTPVVELSPLYDTICTGFSSNIALTTRTVSLHPVRFKYETIYTPVDVEVYVGQDTFNLSPNTFIIDSIINNSSIAQRVDFVVSPYLRGANNSEKCPGIIDTAYVWAAPRLLVQVDSISTYKARTPEIPHNIRCFGENNGFIRLMPVGGITAFPNYDVYDLAYQWSNLKITKDISNLTVGQYSVVIDDKLQCLDKDTFILTQPNKLVPTINIVDTMTCGGSDGKLSVSITGGMEGYIPVWTGPSLPSPEIADTLYNTVDGRYKVVVTDTNLCADSTQEFISEPSPVFAYLDPTYYDYRPFGLQEYNIRCYGENNGIITLLNNSYQSVDYHFYGTGIDTSFTDNDTAIIFSNLSAGIYNVIYNDINNCTGYGMVSLIQPDPLTIEKDSVSLYHSRHNISCNGLSDGSIYLQSITGGHDYANYAYNWQVIDGNGSVNTTGRNQYDIPAGTYSVAIRDTFGCSISDTFEIIQPDPIIINNEIPIAPDGINNLNCAGDSNGYIHLNVTGGDIVDNPYTYNWSNGTLTKDLNNIKKGTYYITVTDGVNCTMSDTFNLSEPPLLKFDDYFVKEYNSYGISCADSTNGMININTSGGSGRHVFDWLLNGNPTGYSGGKLTNIPAGIYNLTVTDTNGCKIFWNDTLTSPQALNLSLQPRNIDCSGDNLGHIKAFASGGTGSLNYLWSNGATNDSIFNLNLGIYSLSVTDINLCQITDSAIIDQDATLILQVNVNNPVSCHGEADGILKVNVNQGIPPFIYHWNTGGSADQLTKASVGTYSVTVTDNVGCKEHTSFDLNEPDPIVLDATITNVSCFSLSDAEIELDATGGNGNYVYRWENNPLENNIVNNLSAGTYMVDIYDIKNCYTDTSVVITQPAPLEIITENIKKAFCPDWGDGEITIRVEGGTPEYNYEWQDYTNVSGPVLSQIKPGWYVVSVTDANNCMTDTSIKMTSNHNICLDIPTAFTPGNNDMVNDYWDVTYVDENQISHKFYDIYPYARVLIYNRWGKLVFEGDINKSFNDGNGIWDGRDNAHKELPVDSYYFMIYLDKSKNKDYDAKGTITIIR